MGISSCLVRQVARYCPECDAKRFVWEGEAADSEECQVCGTPLLKKRPVQGTNPQNRRKVSGTAAPQTYETRKPAVEVERLQPRARSATNKRNRTIQVVIGVVVALVAIGQLASRDTSPKASSVSTSEREASRSARSTNAETTVDVTTTTSELAAPTSTMSREEEIEMRYRESAKSIMVEVISALRNLEQLFQNPDPYDSLWVLSVAGELLAFRGAPARGNDLSPPSWLADSHLEFVETLKTLEEVSYALPKAFDSNNSKEIGRQSQKMWGVLPTLDRLSQSLKPKD